MTCRTVTEVSIIQTALYKVIAELPGKYSVVLKLYYFEDRSYQEIADTLGIPLNTVKIQLLRARGLVRKKLDF